MMHALQLFLVRRRTCPLNLRTELDLSYGLLAGRDVLHYALRLVTIGSDREAGEPSHVKKGQHVTGRQGGDQHFLWINGGSTAHLPTTCGEADAGTTVPPSKLTVWPRL
jgi:hypothetical protein